MPWFAFGPGDELPGDQQTEDTGSLRFDSAPLEATLNILGNTVVQLQISCDQPQALVAVRLCDVWPAPAKTTLQVHTAESYLQLPLRSPGADDGELTEFGSTQTGEAIATTVLRKVDQQRRTYQDAETGLQILEITADNGKQRLDHNQLEMGSHALQRYSIAADDPLSAQAKYDWRWEYGRDDWQVVTETSTSISCDADYFYLKAKSIAWENGQEVLNKRWDKRYLRDHF